MINMKICRVLVAISITLASAVAVFSQRPTQPEDLLGLVTASDAQISPDGQWVVYLASRITGNESRNSLSLIRLMADPAAAATEVERPAAQPNNGNELAGAEFNPSNPRWSPDSKRLAFFATIDGQFGVCTLSLTDRKPRLVAPLRRGNTFVTYAGESLAWAPDSRRLAYINRSEPERHDPILPSGERYSDVRVIDSIQYKSRTGMADGTVTQIEVIDLDLPDPPRVLRSEGLGRFSDHAISWSPKGDEIAFVSNREPDPDAINNSDIYAVNMSGAVRQITVTDGCEYEPAWSPDGKWIAYIATTREVTTIDSVAEDTHIWIVPAEGGRGRELNGRQDRRSSRPLWRGDSRMIYYQASDLGQTLTFGIFLDGAVLPLSRESPLRRTQLSQPPPRNPINLHTFSVSRGMTTYDAREQPFSVGPYQMAAVISDPIHPPEVWLMTSVPFTRAPSGFRTVPRQLTLLNPGYRRNPLSDAEEFVFRSSDGTPIQAWIMKPLNWRADQRYPLVLSIHGGPHGAYGAAFNQTFQILAQSGYAVLYLNPRGSSGYGQRFSDGTLRDWGGGDYRDLMAGVDEALRRYSWIDSDRLGVMGGSYGGYMTNWIIGQTGRFKAAVSLASVSNLISFYATSLYQDLIHAEFGGMPWDNYELLWERSPLKYARAVHTPTLFIHGENDNDVHITQAEEMYMALRRRGVPTVFARYPREGHGFTEPLHRADQLRRTIAWFDLYLKR
jgi:dipeptidyl aminopeptidase/acylaminoacyl peptidase